MPVGRIGRPHGIAGEVTVVPDTDDPGRFAPGSELATPDGTALRVRSARPYRDRGLIVAFEGVADRDAAESLPGTTLLGDAADRRSLGPGEWWPEDLIGLEAVDGSGMPLGTVAGVVVGDVQDRIVVATPGGERVEVPFVDELVDDPAGGVVVIRPPAGLFPEEGRTAPGSR